MLAALYEEMSMLTGNGSALTASLSIEARDAREWNADSLKADTASTSTSTTTVASATNSATNSPTASTVQAQAHAQALSTNATASKASPSKAQALDPQSPQSKALDPQRKLSPPTVNKSEQAQAGRTESDTASAHAHGDHSHAHSPTSSNKAKHSHAHPAQALADTLAQTQTAQTDPAKRLCLEFFFSEVLCPAIAEPERFGVVPGELHISLLARHNLMQIGQLMIKLALSTLEEAKLDPRSASLYEKLDWVFSA